MASSQTSDLLDLFKLETVVTDKCTTHIEYRVDRDRGIRNKKVEVKWNREKSIGGGAFGEVWLEVRREDDDVEKRAVKIINKNKMRRLKVDYEKELLALAKFSKPQYQQQEVLVKFFGWFEDPSHLFLSMEYLELGDLGQHIAEPIMEDEVKDIITDVLNGLRIMHSENFTHRDLKPGNIFVVQKPPASKWWVKIGDFGISKRAQRDVTALRTIVGTPHYMAPEVTGDLDTDEPTLVYDRAVDIWSFGCVTYKIATQRVPFPNLRDVWEFCNGGKPFPEQPLLAKISRDGIEFVKSLMVPNPQKRLSAEAALKVPWLLQRKGDAIIETELAKRSLPATEVASLSQAVNATQILAGPSADESTLNSSTPRILVTSDEEEKMTSAIRSGPYEVDRMLQMGFNVNSRFSERGKPVLHIAAYYGNDKVVELLLQRGANIEAGDDDLRTALHIAALYGHIAVLLMLLRNGANINCLDDSSQTILHTAAYGGKTAMVGLLVEKGLDIEARERMSWTPLHVAAHYGHTAVLDLLLQKGADINALDNLYQTVLHTASYGGKARMVEHLLQLGVSIDARNKFLQTPLHIAAFYGHPAVVQLLVQKGADAQATDSSGQTPLMIAQNPRVRELLFNLPL